MTSRLHAPPINALMRSRHASRQVAAALGHAAAIATAGFLCATALLATTAQAQAQPPLYDLLIRNGRVLDGTGTPATPADIGIRNGRITIVSPTPIPVTSARRVIDATGLTVAPGFIDLHAHLEPLLAMPDAESHVRQGVTLALGGPDGGGAWPLGQYLDSASRKPLGMNVAFLAGHNTIRSTVMGSANRAPTAAELSTMRTMVARAMHEGAFGLSTGLRYVPGFYSEVSEVIALATVAADSGGIYTSHLREEGLGLLEGVAEALEIGRQARIPVVLTHHKAVGRQMWGKSTVTLAMVDSARRVGTDVMIDQYPYTASYTSLSVLVPPWALAGGNSELRRRMSNPALKDSILKGVTDLLLNDRGGGDLKRVQFSRVSWDASLNGKTLHDWAVQRGVPTTLEAAAPLVVEGVLKGETGMVYHVMDEGDVKRIMAHPQTMIASDGRLTRPGDGVPHPRNYGTFPRVLGRYVRDEKTLTLEDAVRKMTSMPAARLGLTDRGCVRVDCAADITIFNAATVADKGTFIEPHQYPVGIEWVIVNGVPVVEQGRFTAARPGQVLRRVNKTRKPARPTTLDILITGGQLVDGTGASPRITDIGLRGNQIVFVGDAKAGSLQATRTIDARGLVVAPGFIDPHAHVLPDLARAASSHLEGYLMQGVTTVLTGNDGGGPIDVATTLANWTRTGIGPNAGVYIGQGTVRGRVVGPRAIPATPAQIDSMRALVRQAMQDGAIGMSSGLFYAPGSFATTEEVIALAKELKPFDGVYDTHQRDESSYGIGLLASTREAMRVGHDAGIKLNISHIKALGVDVWGRSDSLIAMIRNARQAGDKVWADQYPYTASGTSLTASLVPRWAEDGGNSALLARFNNDTLMPRLRREMEDNMRRRGGAESLLLTSARDASWKGKTLAEIAASMKTDPITAAIAVIRNGGGSVASFNMKQSDIDALAAEPWVMTGSDGSDGHPRKYGTFTKKLRAMVLDGKVLSLEAMVHQSAALPAEVFGLTGRGVLKPGAFADVIVFDPATVRDRATYIEPQLLAVGMRYVFVNGVLVVNEGKPTRATPGRALHAHEGKPQ